MTTLAGRWIPPEGFIFGQLAFGASWIVLLVVALRGAAGVGLAALGWVHLVALGWLTMTALSVLVHVIPSFTDAVWRWESLARRSLAVFAAGVLVLVAGFLSATLSLLPWGGLLVGLGLAGYAVPAAFTLVSAFRVGKVEATIARGLGATLAFLLVAAGFGVAFTLMLDGRVPASSLAFGAPAHAALGLVGWLTVLAMGVSARTVAPITGGRSRRPWCHSAAGAAQALGTIGLAAGFAMASPAVVWSATIVLGAGIAIYVADLADVLRRATVRHRPPQAFLAAAALWLVVAFALGAGALGGFAWGSALIYVATIGWLGQIVLAHVHHIGVRLLATAFRGDDDETRPDVLLSAPLSWTAFALFQVAVALGLAALLADSSGMLATAAVAGFFGWIAMVANALFAARRASRPPALISLLGVR